MIYGRDNREIVERIKRHPDFADFIVPMSGLGEIRDATFFLRGDGLLAFSEGYCHPGGKLVGNIIYIPDERGSKTFFGVPYGSIIKKYAEGEGDDEWVTFKDQLEIYRRIDPSTQSDKPVFAENKCVFDLNDFIGFAPHLRSLEIVRSRVPRIDETIRSIASLLGISPEQIGCTGSMAFGNLASVHDLDLVFYVSMAEAGRIISTIYEVTKDPKRQVFEMGMLWAIRFLDDEGNVICPFFSYADPEDIPLRRFECEVTAEGITAEATVRDDSHTGFMPTFLPLAGAHYDGGQLAEGAPLIIYHGGKRGEYRRGDRVRARGRIVRVTTPSDSYDAVLVTDMGNTEKI